MHDLKAITLQGTEVVLAPAVIDAFRAELRGKLLTPAEADYEAARRIWNAMIDKRPALIARCEGAADVGKAVRFAAAHELLVSVRGGGHNVAGTAVCDGGLMIDLSRMRGIRVDPVARTALAQPGLLWQEFDQETQAYGLATTGGVVGETGIAGLTLGGGVGWLVRKYGPRHVWWCWAQTTPIAGSPAARPRQRPRPSWRCAGARRVCTATHSCSLPPTKPGSRT
jgi:hypothetical protein